ncbi:hypothetical protein FBU30_010019 [Linnemannia zychae]|nr:hypothetical protein FBU30_010019 [Linnemannia zychae]
MSSHEYDFNALRKRKKSSEPSKDAFPLHSYSSSSSQWNSSQNREHERGHDGGTGRKQRSEEELSMNQDLTLQFGYILHGVISYCWDLIRGTLMILRPLFSIILAILVLLLLVGALTRSLVVFRSEVQTRIVCRLPFASYVVDCPDEALVGKGGTIQVPDFADLIDKQAASYESIVRSLNVLNPAFIKKNLNKKIKGSKTNLFARRKGKTTLFNSEDKIGYQGQEDDEDEDEDPYGLLTYGSTSEGGRLPLPMILKRAELAVVDLKMLVLHSNLPETPRLLLAEQLESLHNQAKVTSRKLQFLQAKANGCVDGLVIRNVYLLVELDRLEEQRERLLGEGREGGTRNGIISRMWEFFAGTHELEMAASEKKLQQLYQSTMEDASKHVRDLILQVQDVLHNLDTMDQILSNIHKLTLNERKQQKILQGEVLSQLWAQLGGRRVQREMYKENLRLLQDMDGQRKATVGQIQSALLKLTDFEAETGILRERIVDAVMDGALRETTNSEDSTFYSFEETVKAPVEDNKSTNSGLKRMSTASLKAHIQQIDRVTSRLKERSFLAEAIIKAQADQIPPAAPESPDASPLTPSTPARTVDGEKPMF